MPFGLYTNYLKTNAWVNGLTVTGQKCSSMKQFNLSYV